MLTGGMVILVGMACGLRLTILPFLVVMVSVLVGLAVDATLADRPVFIGSMPEWIMAWFSIQLGYASGIWLSHFD